MKVLVVDDEENYRHLVQDVLESAGMEVKTCMDGQQALDEIKAFQPDIALVDWAMPRMDGEHFCRAVRADKEWRELPIAMFTVKKESDAQLEAIHFGVDEFIAKPFEPSELVARIKAVARRSEKK